MGDLHNNEPMCLPSNTDRENEGVRLETGEVMVLGFLGILELWEF